MPKWNKYGVSFDNNYYDTFSFNWLGAKVSFAILGQTVIGKIKGTSSMDSMLTAEFYDSGKRIEVTGDVKLFTKLE